MLSLEAIEAQAGLGKCSAAVVVVKRVRRMAGRMAHAKAYQQTCDAGEADVSGKTLAAKAAGVGRA